MLTIYKYYLGIEDAFEIEMHDNAKVLTVQTQNNIAFIWAMVDTNAPVNTRIFYVKGTGHDLDPSFATKKYIGTIQLSHFVFHVFE